MKVAARVLAIELKFCLVEFATVADFNGTSKPTDAAREERAEIRRRASNELRPAVRIPELISRRAAAHISRKEN
jgi:hypothetical protein